MYLLMIKNFVFSLVVLGLGADCDPVTGGSAPVA